jgi:hypothetical protein
MPELNTTLAVNFDFVVKQNQTFNPLLTFLHDDDSPVDFTGTTIKLSVREKDGCGCNRGCSPHDTNFNQVYKQDFVPNITGSGDNELQFDDVIELAPGKYVYDMLVVWPDGEQQYYLKGKFKVEKSYTDANDN